MRAWASFRAAAFPVETNCCRPIRSSAVKVTRYLSIALLLRLEDSALPASQETGTQVTCQMKIDGITSPYAQHAREVTEHIRKEFFDPQSGVYFKSETVRKPDYVWLQSVMFSNRVAAARS